LVALLMAMPEGPGQIVRVAADHDKFSLGSFGPSLAESTFWVVLAYGVTINLGNFAVDQGYVQRYITARSDRAASQSVCLGAVLYVPMAAVFFFMGTGLFALYAVRPELLPSTLDAAKAPDHVFPFFIVHQLPAGLAGLVIAAIFAAAMDPSLNSMATLTLCDVYQRYVRPVVGERESMWVLRLATLGWGAISTSVALAMIQAKNALDVWWERAGIFSGGLLGLFLLGLICRRAGSRSALGGVILGVLVILWLTISPRPLWPEWLSSFRSPFHNLLATVIGTLTVLIAGVVLSLWSTDDKSAAGR
jgi:SSS family solute:Na+ symporter